MILLFLALLFIPITINTFIIGRMAGGYNRGADKWAFAVAIPTGVIIFFIILFELMWYYSDHHYLHTGDIVSRLNFLSRFSAYIILIAFYTFSLICIFRFKKGRKWLAIPCIALALIIFWLNSHSFTLMGASGIYYDEWIINTTEVGKPLNREDVMNAYAPGELKGRIYKVMRKHNGLEIHRLGEPVLLVRSSFLFWVMDNEVFNRLLNDSAAMDLAMKADEEDGARIAKYFGLSE